MHPAHVIEPSPAHLHNAPLPRRKPSRSGRSRASSPPACNGLPLPPDASPRLIARITSLAERAPEGSALMPMTLLHRRFLPLLAGEREVIGFNARITRAVRDWGRRQGAEVRLALIPDLEPWRGLHCHGLLIAPHRLAKDARQFVREAVARHAGVDRLPPHAVRFECKRGPVSPSQAGGWLAYAAKCLVRQGATVEGVRGVASPGRCVRARRLNLPRFDALPAPVVEPAVTYRAPANGPCTIQLSAATTPAACEAINSLSEIIAMPASTAADERKKRRNRLHALSVREISLCREGRNPGALVRIIKAADGDAIAVSVVELDEPEMRVAGWASIVEADGSPVADDQGDEIDAQTLREAARGFMIESRRGGVSHGKNHDILTVDTSIVMDPQTMKAMGFTKPLPFTGWWIEAQVNDKATYERLIAGELTAFSIGGTALRIAVEDDDDEIETVTKSRSGGARTLNEILASSGAIAKAKSSKSTAPSGSPAAQKGWRPCNDCAGSDACRRAGRCGMEIRPATVKKAALPIAVEAARAGMRRISGVLDTADLQARADRAESVSKARPSDAVARARAVVSRTAATEAERSTATPAAISGAPVAVQHARTRLRALAASSR